VKNYQLTHWQKTEEDAEKFLDTFHKYGERRRVEIRKSADGYALFTDGGLRIGSEAKQ